MYTIHIYIKKEKRTAVHLGLAQSKLARQLGSAQCAACEGHGRSGPAGGEAAHGRGATRPAEGRGGG